jgi:hypothetical protein
MSTTRYRMVVLVLVLVLVLELVLVLRVLCRRTVKQELHTHRQGVLYGFTVHCPL